MKFYVCITCGAWKGINYITHCQKCFNCLCEKCAERNANSDIRCKKCLNEEIEKSNKEFIYEI